MPVMGPMSYPNAQTTTENQTQNQDQSKSEGVIISVDEFEKLRNLLDYLQANIPANDATAELLTRIAECKNALDSKTEPAQSSGIT